MKKNQVKQSKVINDFQLEILKQVNSKNIGRNILVSPLSIYHILSLAANGAANKTLSEMLNLLGDKNQSDLNKKNELISSIISQLETVKMANAIFTKFKPEETFLKSVAKYESTIDELKSVEQVNSWCSKATNNIINHIINSIDNSLMILINAIYFKGNWKIPFYKNSTEKLPFYNYNKQETLIDFMKVTNKFDYFEDENIQAIKLDYNKDDLSAVIILPKKEKEKDINNYIKNFNTEKYNSIIKALRTEEVNLSLPKFEIDYEEELNDSLIKMGMKEAFINADFSKMKREKDINISNVIHKTYIKVDEEGTVAAAVTAIDYTFAGSIFDDYEEIFMDVNHPFLFVIRSSYMPDGHDILFFTKIESL